MFTGIIAAIGQVAALQHRGGDVRLQIAVGKLDISDVQMGDSIANNGVCLTVIDMDKHQLAFDVSRETLERSSLGMLKVGDKVNLEKALAVGDRLGGHFVSGHVDGLGRVMEMQTAARSTVFRVEVPEPLARYIAEKGSICIDGTSLTVNAVGPNWFEVNIIPHTMKETIIQYYQIGTKVNLEVDIIARYLERLLQRKQDGISVEWLKKQGFMAS